MQSKAIRFWPQAKSRAQPSLLGLTSILLGNGVTQDAKKCGLQPGVAYRLWNGDRAVEVLVCFKCNVLWPHIVGGKSEGRCRGDGQDFNSVRADLLALKRKKPS